MSIEIVQPRRVRIEVEPEYETENRP